MQKTIALVMTLVILFLCTVVLTAADRKEVDDEKKADVPKNTNSNTPVKPQLLKADDIVIPAEYQEVTREDAADMMTRAIMAGEDINWQVIPGGGFMQGTSTNYILSGSVGQVAVGEGTSTNYAVNSGFWQDFPAVSNECNMAGNANGDETVNIGDIVFLVNYIFRGGPPPGLVNEGDANADCSLNIGDPVFLVNYVFKSGPAPTCGCVFTK